MNNDRVHLFNDAEAADRTHIVLWPHNWPPPEHLAVVVGRLSGVIALVVCPMGIDELSAGCIMTGTTLDDMYEVTYYTRDTYSGLPEDMGPNVSRGARYIKEKT